jgi:hypothetical protein
MHTAQTTTVTTAVTIAELSALRFVAILSWSFVIDLSSTERLSAQAEQRSGCVL